MSNNSIKLIEKNNIDDTNDHFGGVFVEDEGKISLSTKELIDKTIRNINIQKDENKKMKDLFENLEEKWCERKNNILKDKIKSEFELKSSDNYFELYSQFQELQKIKPISNENEEKKLHEINKEKISITDTTTISADQLKLHNEIKDLSAPKFFIQPDTFNDTYDELIQENDILMEKNKNFIQKSYDELFIYYDKIWWDEILKLPFSDKITQLNNILHDFLHGNEQLNNLIYKQIIKFSKNYTYIFLTKIRILLKHLNNKINDNFIFKREHFLLFVLIYRIVPCFINQEEIIDASIQIIVNIIKLNLKNIKLCKKLCHLIYKFICNDTVYYIPEIIIFFKTTHITQYLSMSYLKIVRNYMTIWHDLKHFRYIFDFAPHLIQNMSQCSSQSQQLNDISLEIHKLYYSINDKTPLKDQKIEFFISKTKLLKQFEPEFKTIYIKERNPQTKAKSLKKHFKNEFKNAIKVLKDNASMSNSKQLKNVIIKDQDRKSKVEKLYNFIKQDYS